MKKYNTNEGTDPITKWKKVSGMQMVKGLKMQQTKIDIESDKWSNQTKNRTKMETYIWEQFKKQRYDLLLML